jgi:hypothetical protein
LLREVEDELEEHEIPIDWTRATCPIKSWNPPEKSKLAIDLIVISAIP